MVDTWLTDIVHWLSQWTKWFGPDFEKAFGVGAAVGGIGAFVVGIGYFISDLSKSTKITVKRRDDGAQFTIENIKGHIDPTDLVKLLQKNKGE